MLALFADVHVKVYTDFFFFFGLSFPAVALTLKTGSLLYHRSTNVHESETDMHKANGQPLLRLCYCLVLLSEFQKVLLV